MTKEEIIESNKLIAEFMEVIERSGHFYFESIPQFNESMIAKEDALNYHSSWDWLMPVVEKVTYNTQPFNRDLYNYIKEGLVKCEIKTTWKSVVEFIKWYNTQTK